MSTAPGGADPDSSSCTFQEIFQQPSLWPTTLERIDAASARLELTKRQDAVGDRVQLGFKR